MWCVHPDLTQIILDHYNKKWGLGNIAENARAVKVGKVVKGEKYVLMFKGEPVVNAKACDLTEGFKYNRPHETPKKRLNKFVHFLLH